jgi:hypothetical protein
VCGGQVIRYGDCTFVSEPLARSDHLHCAIRYFVLVEGPSGVELSYYESLEAYHVESMKPYGVVSITPDTIVHLLKGKVRM